MEIEFHEFPLTLRIPRSAFIVPTPPATVTQRTVEQHFGIPPRIYRNMIRDGLFPARKIGRLFFAAYDDVKLAVTKGAVGTHSRLATLGGFEEPKAGEVAEEVVGYLIPSKAVGAKRERRQATADDAWDLIRGYGEKLPDGSPNPKHDPALLREGFDMLFATVGLRRPGATPASRGAGAGPYGKCCWCDRPAYATKQTWMADEWFWNGGPVCEVCARARKANERVVRFENQQILLPALDPSVPQGWERPRRPRKGR